jgi:hypothetical protein
MKLEGKTVIVTSNSSVFLKLTKLFIDNSGNSRSDFIIIAENGLPNRLRFKKRIKKVGLLSAIDEWLYYQYEALFNHWTNAESKLLNDIDIISFKLDILTDTVNDSSIDVINQLKKYDANNIISIGSGYIPTNLLKKYSLKINIHPGILPNYKGIGTPEAIMNGDMSFLGWSIHELAPKIDAGNIIYNHIISYDELKNMSFAEIYITIYISSIKHFLTIPYNFLKIENNTNPQKKYNAFISFTQYIKFSYKPAHNSV